MKRIALAVLLSISVATPAFACECAEFPDAAKMLRYADFAYVGEWVRPAQTPAGPPADAPVSFKVESVIAGSQKIVGSTIALDRKKDAPPECRGFVGEPRGKFLVFGEMYEDRKATFLTDCKNDIVSVGPQGSLTFRGKPAKENVMSLRALERPKLASEMTEDDAIELARTYAKTVKKYDMNYFTALNARLKDMNGFRPFWVARFSSADGGEVFEVKLYTSEMGDMELIKEE